MDKNKKIAEDVLSAVGGKENVTSVLHCMTRLRFTLKDQSLVNVDDIKKVDGIMGCQIVGGQLQVIVGQNVDKVYSEICDLGGFAKTAGLDESLDKEPVT